MLLAACSPVSASACGGMTFGVHRSRAAGRRMRGRRASASPRAGGGITPGMTSRTEDPGRTDEPRRPQSPARRGTGWRRALSLRRRHDDPAATAAAASRARQREEFGGISWPAALVGWLAAAGLAALLTGLVAAAGAVLAVTDVASDSAAETIGIVGGVALVVVLAIAYWLGGWAAGRMARFDGGRQGFAVWVVGILAAGVIALVALVGGAEYNVLDRLNIPRVPVDSGTLTTGGLVALLASFVVTLVAAMAGGKVGERFHRKVDRLA